MRKSTENIEISKYAAERGIFYWQISAKIGVGESTFSRMMRRKLDAEIRDRVLTAIDELAAERASGRKSGE